MNVLLNNFESGWIGLQVEISPEEIDLLVEKLVLLKSRKLGHFHIRCGDFGESVGVADIEFSQIDSKDGCFSIE